MSERASLSLVMPSNKSPISSTITTPSDPGSRSSSPDGQRLTQSLSEAKSQRDELANRSFLNHALKSPQNPVQTSAQQHAETSAPIPSNESRSPILTSLPQLPQSPKSGPKHTRDQSKSFFANLKASKSSNRVYQVEPTIRQVSEDTSRSKGTSKENILYSMRKSPGSTPDLSLSAFNNSSPEVPDGKL